MNKKIKFAFFGTPDVAKDTLDILKAHGYLPSLIVTSPDARQGRKMLLTPPPVKVWAQVNDVPVLQPEKFDGEFTKKLGGSDMFIVVAYGKIIPEKILNLPELGSYNIHYSLLPKYRGASPVESAILNGDPETGVTIQKMVYKMDAGPVVAQEKVVILPDETAPELRRRLIQIGSELLVKTLPAIAGGTIDPLPQDESRATFSKKIQKSDGLVDLTVGSPAEIYNKFRAYHYWPRIFFFHNGKRVIITDATLESGEFKIRKVLPEGRKEISWEEFRRNY